MAKTSFVSAVIGAAVTAAAFLLNPTPQQHHAKVQAALAEQRPIASALGLGLLTVMATEYHSLGIASYTTLDQRTLTVGALGMVVVLPQDKPR